MSPSHPKVIFLNFTYNLSTFCSVSDGPFESTKFKMILEIQSMRVSVKLMWQWNKKLDSMCLTHLNRNTWKIMECNYSCINLTSLMLQPTHSLWRGREEKKKPTVQTQGVYSANAVIQVAKQTATLYRQTNWMIPEITIKLKTHMTDDTTTS